MNIATHSIERDDRHSMPKTHTSRPTVSVILAAFNEAPRCERVINSLLQQFHREFDIEILAIDGKSTDGTCEILRRLAKANSHLRVLVNEQRKTPFAFNLGLREAKGDYVCICGSHSVYDADYLSVCLDELRSHNVVGCGGRVFTTPANNSLQARLVAAALSHPFGTSGKSFRTQPEGYVDTVNYPVYVRQALLDIGGYDEELHRNQDNDLNQRLRARGHRLYMTSKTGCRYFVQATVPLLLKYGWISGYWNFISFKKNMSALAIRHFVPFFFALACSLATLLAVGGLPTSGSFRFWMAIPLLILVAWHFSVGMFVGTCIGIRQRWAAALLLAPVFLSFHLSYGLGTLWALLCNARTPRMQSTIASKRSEELPMKEPGSQPIPDLRGRSSSL